MLATICYLLCDHVHHLISSLYSSIHHNSCIILITVNNQHGPMHKELLTIGTNADGIKILSRKTTTSSIRLETTFCMTQISIRHISSTNLFAPDSEYLIPHCGKSWDALHMLVSYWPKRINYRVHVRNRGSCELFIWLRISRSEGDLGHGVKMVPSLAS
jgi:hemin uptake protein HemP